ncbi:hypothetical protein [Rhodococcus sp. BP22]|uniref:hypothetical protein n=1 Tax=Rhodococcus sp. BP22 TaxID=2758566 RepID=UPI0028F6D795|nr:hypothetical protein [Rhodococcus sp. BP22]
MHLADTERVPTAVDVLQSAAFGANPGLWPLPSAHDPTSMWLRAIALGGQGRYALGRAELDTLENTLPAGRTVLSLAGSTRASWSRQIGDHRTAERFDGLAIALVGVTGGVECPLLVEARCDALTGLAADALGSGRFALSSAFLDRCSSTLAQYPSWDLWRPQLRLRWVMAELAMFSGDGPAAVRHALDARERATDIVSLRHRVKTDLVAAAAYSSVGDLDGARALAYSVLDACSEIGLLPLRWASAMLAYGIGEGSAAEKVVAESAALLGRRGGDVIAV